MDCRRGRVLFNTRDLLSHVCRRAADWQTLGGWHEFRPRARLPQYLDGRPLGFFRRPGAMVRFAGLQWRAPAHARDRLSGALLVVPAASNAVHLAVRAL